MNDNVALFKTRLIEKTRECRLEWKPLIIFPNWNEFEKAIRETETGIDFGFNSIRITNSYYLQSGEGYVFLFEIYHGDPSITSPEMDTVALMVKVNNLLPIDNLTINSETEQEQLRSLQILVENYCAGKYTYQNILNTFFTQVLEEDK